ncbi:MAG: DNA translocase FtsK 4TM domain-containing protein [Rhizobiales bacterium]|nr:DNA translocase FtsK 4TM domain-containing protein [Hyphomicrobiales bacterium]
MAVHETYDTDDSAIPAALRRFVRNRAYELSGMILLGGVALAGVSLASWSAQDPSFNHATGAIPTNWLGYPGAVVADLLAQHLGLASLAFLFIPLAWVYRLFSHEDLVNFKWSFLHWLLAVLGAALLTSVLPPPASWPLAGGMGGQVGDSLANLLVGTLSAGLKPILAQMLAAAAGAVLLGWSGLRAMGLTGQHTRVGVNASGRLLGRTATLGWGAALSGAGAVTAGAGFLSRLWQDTTVRKANTRRDATEGEDILTRLAPARGLMRGKRKIEPTFLDDDSDSAGDAPPPPAPALDEDEDLDFVNDEDAEELPPPAKVAKSVVKPKQKRKTADVFDLPDLDLLSEPKRPSKQHEVSADVLEANARNLEGVLDDFGVKGQIIDVKPGPVVTLYELEPAPGIKSSRVISLADDIARSMSAISARVAVVQGRNAIGIELPNAKRETVFLREMFAAPAFASSTANLMVALGKNIGGEPIYADLARMPHLLIAGTTGSGKSVGINTMILSLLYRLSPERCKLIMIDPKMLELSVYEGIPHLLAPVVTDPRKAVVALKWAVREMEERYKKMSKVGVRNIDGFNTRVAQMLEKGEKLSRTVQTGFDPDTGQPIFEQEEMETAAMPYIVVIIDEMADLMMVAGKDIEGAVQRLAQMARAAGIHVIMATQRPSVDVITGTIKANFPTRISFQVTSKIDSRTILGEQGAEQLLGQGDMLYMAGGGRISRLHGPFVSDSEVEAIVRHLKSQGSPDYVDAVTEEPEEGGYGEPGAAADGGSGDDLYDQAVAVVLRDKKVSTSYIQRRLQVGYNKAASLIERMEKEGLISTASATGKREILVPGDSARV